MPLPKSHMAALRANLKAHTEAIAELRRRRDAIAKEIERREAGDWRDPNPKPEGIPGMVAWLERIEREIAAHEGQLELARDPRWVAGLAELLEDPKLVKAAARNPRAYARKLGVELPPEIEVELTAVADRIHLKVTGHDPVAPFELSWTDDGFSRPVGRAPSESPTAQGKKPRRTKAQPRRGGAPKRA